MQPSYQNWEVVLKNSSHHIYIYIYIFIISVYLLFCCIYNDVMYLYALSIHKVEEEGWHNAGNCSVSGQCGLSL